MPLPRVKGTSGVRVAISNKEQPYFEKFSKMDPLQF